MSAIDPPSDPLNVFLEPREVPNEELIDCLSVKELLSWITPKS